MKRHVAEMITRDPEKFAHHDRVFKNNPVVMQGMGLAPLVVKDIFRHIVELRDRLGLTVLLVEQNARSALKIADRGYVLENGRVILQGTASELLANRDVQRAYLGRELEE